MLTRTQPAAGTQLRSLLTSINVTLIFWKHSSSAIMTGTDRLQRSVLSFIIRRSLEPALFVLLQSHEVSQVSGGW